MSTLINGNKYRGADALNLLIISDFPVNPIVEASISRQRREGVSTFVSN
jgi:hypothetical protein